MAGRVDAQSTFMGSPDGKWLLPSTSVTRGVFAHPGSLSLGLGLTMIKTVWLRLLYSFDVGSRRLSLKLLLTMRKDSEMWRSSWTAAGSRAVVLLGLGLLLLPSTTVEVCLGAMLP